MVWTVRTHVSVAQLGIECPLALSSGSNVHIPVQEGDWMKLISSVCASTVLALGLVGGLSAQNSTELSGKSQAKLEKEVRHELVLQPLYDVFDNLEYKVNGSTVTLMGQVAKPTLKADAEKAVRQIEGVERVDNQIEVLPLSPNDDRIRVAVYRAVYGTPGLDRYAMRAVPTIHIIIKNGNVFLEGATATEMDKNLAGVKANGVSGVFSVTNNLRTDRP
jgi:hyperosmotically inducible protein